MAKVSYANLKLKTKADVESFEFGGHQIEVLQYLPIQDKYDLVMIALQKSYEQGIYNPIKLDLFFHLYIVFMYTNISFTEKQKENLEKLYDTIESNGLLDLILDKMDEHEYASLINYLEEIKEADFAYGASVASIVNKFVDDLPAAAEAAMGIVDSFDKEKYQAVIDFAEAANGGRKLNFRP